MTGDMTFEASMEAEYREANVSVWWDINNCPAVGATCLRSIAGNIKLALSNLGYGGPVSISAYGDTSVIPESDRRGLSSIGISLNHVDRGLTDENLPELLLEMLSWALHNPAPATILLICGESIISNALRLLGSNRYHILLAPPSKAYHPPAAKTVWFWASLLAGGSPITIRDETPPTEADYLAAKTSVWWHIEHCPVPGGYVDVKAIAERIKSPLVDLSYSGPISIFAYGDPDSIPESVKRDLSSTEISLNYVSGGNYSDEDESKYATVSERKMLSDVMIWALNNPAPANVFLISGDSVFSAALHHLGENGYNIFLARQRGGASCPTLAAAAKTEWCWDDLLGCEAAAQTGFEAAQTDWCWDDHLPGDSALVDDVPIPIPIKKYTVSGDVTGGYLTAKTSVWWDIEDCYVPRKEHSKSFARNIKSALFNLGYRGPVSIFAYGYPMFRIPDYVRSDYASTGISLNPIASGEDECTGEGSRYSTNMKMKVEMSAWALENAAPANVLLISKDLDLHSTLEALDSQGFNILLGTCAGGRAAPLLAFAKTAWEGFYDLLAGDPPADSSYLTSLLRSSAEEDDSIAA